MACICTKIKCNVKVIRYQHDGLQKIKIKTFVVHKHDPKHSISFYFTSEICNVKLVCWFVHNTASPVAYHNLHGQLFEFWFKATHVSNQLILLTFVMHLLVWVSTRLHLTPGYSMRTIPPSSQFELIPPASLTQ